MPARAAYKIQIYSTPALLSDLQQIADATGLSVSHAAGLLIRHTLSQPGDSLVQALRQVQPIDGGGGDG